jgi:branched-chain amino acid transport system permease protein
VTVIANESLQFLFTGLAIGSIYALVALSFTFIFNAGGVVNFAQGEFVMLGGFFAVTLTTWQVPLWLAAAGAVIGVGLVAGVIYMTTIRRLPNASTFTLIMITLGLAIVIHTIAQLVWGTQAKTLPELRGGEPFRIAGASITAHAILVMVVSATLMVMLYLFFKRTRPGQAMLAYSDNREGAALVGVNAKRVGLAAFILGGAVGGLAGFLVTPITTVNYLIGLTFTLKGFSAAVLGGFGNAGGAVAGGLLLGLLETFSTGILPSGYEGLVPLTILVLILMVRPGGIFGSRALFN